MAENRLPRIDTLKVDCEGGEYELLLQAGGETLSRVRTIVGECHAVADGKEGWTPEGLAESLTQNGFDVDSLGRVFRAERSRR